MSSSDYSKSVHSARAHQASEIESWGTLHTSSRTSTPAHTARSSPSAYSHRSNPESYPSPLYGPSSPLGGFSPLLSYSQTSGISYGSGSLPPQYGVSAPHVPDVHLPSASDPIVNPLLSYPPQAVFNVTYPCNSIAFRNSLSPNDVALYPPVQSMTLILSICPTKNITVACSSPGGVTVHDVFIALSNCVFSAPHSYELSGLRPDVIARARASQSARRRANDTSGLRWLDFLGGYVYFGGLVKVSGDAYEGNRPRSGREKEALKYNDRHHEEDDSEDSESATEDGSRLHDDDSDDQYHLDDHEYVMMAVTKREQREILKRRDEEAAHSTRASYHQSRRYLAESSRYRSKKNDSKRSTTKSAGAGLFDHARGVTVTGESSTKGAWTVETMGEPFSMNTPRDHPLQTPPPEEDMHNRRTTDDFAENDSEGLWPTGEPGASSSRTRNEKLRSPRRRPFRRGSQLQRSAETDVSIFSFSEDVHISGGEIAAVKRNQTIRISRYT
ncbi:hypothetical protein D9757_011961 [Collybiopsis confluens]|uniref:DUF6699 domain-containing protein n=1 Tax=Collybiopsis confluens TaxID=2823264 RepID=A0A8H5GGC0_9AGAR|nr:hypothetical protein D9757_011961 [Collybiopsis confluens]